MTIDSQWAKILKSSVPNAFSASIPVIAKTWFIDGQIKLMKADYIRSWDQFLRAQFVAPIELAWASGATYVVLGFDNYDHVPASKGPTQVKRNRATSRMEFKSSESLPDSMPEDWNSAMRNRAFKIKVINFIVNNLQKHYASLRHRTLVLDWKGISVLGDELAIDHSRDYNRGECDIKAFLYSTLGPMCIYSTDGDFIPMSMLHISKSVREHGTEPRIVLYRMTANVEVGSKKSRTGNRFEYVDANKILGFLQRDFDCEFAAQKFAALTALCGCDFTLSLPYIGPKKLWTNRILINNKQPLDLDLLNTFLVNLIERCYGKKLTRVGPKSLADVLARIHSMPSLNARLKAAIWSPGRTEAHAKNTLWTLMYWEMLNDAPNPLELTDEQVSAFGYITASGGQVQFDGMA